MENIISADELLPEPYDSVVVYFNDPDVRPEVDYLEYDQSTGLMVFANNRDRTVIFWCDIPKHPKT